MRKTALLLAALAAGPAAAHQAPSGFVYDEACCSSADCAPVTDEAVREVQGGYAVVVAPGTHPMVPPGREAVRVFVPHGDPRIRPSGDGLRHACVARFSPHVYCIYVPPGGV